MQYCRLTGGDDQSSWFAINDSIVIRPEKKDDTNNSYFSIKFPPVNYKYLRLFINNQGKNPFNIIGISTETSCGDSRMLLSRITYPSTENPTCMISQKDTGNNSYIKISQQDSFHFNEIHLKLNGSKYYLRKADLFLFSSEKNNFSQLGQLVSSFEFSNNSTLKFRLPIVKAKAFCIIIHNEDNPPLKVESLNTYITYRVATAWLEKQNHYSILLDNPVANKPNYDIQKKDLYSPKDFPVVQVGKFALLLQRGKLSIPTHNNSWMIWLLIVIAIFVLGFFTYKLITDMNKSKS